MEVDGVAVWVAPWHLRLLLAGAVVRWDPHPQESAAVSRRTAGVDFQARRSFRYAAAPRVTQGKHKVVAPGAVDEQIVPSQALVLKTHLF